VEAWDTPTALKERERVSALVALYSQTRGEITRYRDLEWKLPSLVLVLLGATVAAFRGLAMTDAARVVVPTLFCLFSLLVSIIGIAHLLYVHWLLTEERRVARRIESLFEFCRPGAYDNTSASLLAEEKTRRGYPWMEGLYHLLSWIALIVVSTVYTLTSIVLS